MTITLIHTPLVHPVHHITSNRPIPPLGLAYINASLREHGFETYVIDAAGEGIDDFLKIENTNLVINGIDASKIIKMIPEHTDVIGLSAMHTNRWIYDSFIIKSIKNKFPDMAIVIGGEHTTGAWYEIMRDYPTIDYCILGEGEVTFVELVKNVLNNKKQLSYAALRNIDGIVYRNEFGAITCNKRRKRVENIDKIPFPSWDGFPLHNYFKFKSGIASFSKKTMPMIASRGCPFSCSFCTCKNMWNSQRISRSVKNVVSEIKELKRKYAIEHIDFLDLTFVQSKEWISEFTSELSREKINISWALPIGTRTEHLDREILKKLRISGLQRILYSPESGSVDTLKKINKNLNLAKFNQVVRHSIKEGFIIKFAIIIGFPEQKIKDIGYTFFFIAKAAVWGINDVVCLSFVPYPGSKLFEQLINEKKIQDAFFDIYLSNDLHSMRSWSKHIPSALIPIFSISMMAMFYSIQYILRPWRLLQCFYRIIIAKSPVTTFETIIFYFFSRLRIKHQ